VRDSEATEPGPVNRELENLRTRNKELGTGNREPENNRARGGSGPLWKRLRYVRLGGVELGQVGIHVFEIDV
jgi:hypothetical protein